MNSRVRARVRGRGRVNPTLGLKPLARETASTKQFLTKPIPSWPYERCDFFSSLVLATVTHSALCQLGIRQGRAPLDSS